jgi:DNA-directed RNA polymerase specialized sigma24 family protein
MDLYHAAAMDHAGSQKTQAFGAGSFGPTQWSLVALAARTGEEGADEALNKLCSAYWYPIYCYVRRRGYPPDDAQDLVQGFFARLLKKKLFNQADRSQGRLRGFLLSNLQYFLLDERKRHAAAKRGGGAVMVSFDAEDAETRYVSEPCDMETPDAVFERRWAAVTMQRAADVLADVWRQRGRFEVFDALSPYLVSSMDAAATRRIGALLGMTEGNAKVTLNRMREHYAEVLRQEIAATVNSEDEVDEELAALRLAIG